MRKNKHGCILAHAKDDNHRAVASFLFVLFGFLHEMEHLIDIAKPNKAANNDGNDDNDDDDDYNDDDD